MYVREHVLCKVNWIAESSILVIIEKKDKPCNQGGSLGSNCMNWLNSFNYSFLYTTLFVLSSVVF